MSKARDLADFISTGSILSDGTLETVEIDGVTATPVELNKLDGATVTTAEINYLSGVTSAVQTQVDTKAPTASPMFTGDVTLPDKIVHTGDTDTAIRFPADDTVAFETGGSERLRVGSSGQIGIGGATYGTSGQVLTSGGSGAAPSWTTISAGAPFSGFGS